MQSGLQTLLLNRPRWRPPVERGLLSWADCSAKNQQFQDTAGTVLASAQGQSVRRLNSRQGSVYWSAAAGATLKTNANGGKRALTMDGGITAGWSATNLTITSARNCTVFAAYRCSARGQPAGHPGNGVVEIGSGNYFWIGTCQILSNQTGFQGANPDPDGPCVFCMTSGASGITQRLNGVELFTTASMLADAPTSGVSFAGFFDNGSYAWHGDWYGMAVYDRVLSAAEIAAVETRFLADWPAPQVGPDRPLIVWDGDSIPAGVIASLNANQASDLVVATLGAADYYGRNLARGGRFTAQCTADAPTRIDPLYNAARSANICVFHEITNEIISDTSAATAYANVKDYGNGRKAVGWKVIILTCLPRTGFSGPQNTARLAVNASLLGDFTTATANPYVWLPGAGGTYGDAVVDVASVPNLTDPAVQPYYGIDGTHLADAGYVDYAAPVAAAVPLI